LARTAIGYTGTPASPSSLVLVTPERGVPLRASRSACASRACASSLRSASRMRMREQCLRRRDLNLPVLRTALEREVAHTVGATRHDEDVNALVVKPGASEDLKPVWCQLATTAS